MDVNIKETVFSEKKEFTPMAQNILEKRYLAKGETNWEQVVDRVIGYVLSKDSDDINLTREMILNRYFIPNSPCLVNSGKQNGGLLACFVVGFKDSIEEIYKTKLDFALIAKKGGGCGTSLSFLRPEREVVNGSVHGYAGGPVKFFDTICHDMEVITQAGFREMAMMGTMSVYHPDIIKFITSKSKEGVMRTTNISVVVDSHFMECVEADAYYDTEFNGKIYSTLKARDVFNLIVEGAWKNGEPGLLFFDAINDSPYKYAGIEINATNPCISGDTLIQTVEGKIRIKELVGREVDVYCQVDNGTLGISRAFNIRKTRENAELIRVSTSRGDLICTPDHLIYTKNRGYVAASELTKKDKLVGLNKKMFGERYCAVSLTGTNKYIREHRFVAGHYNDITDKIVHHKDGNTLNNSASNLEVMEHSEHSSMTNVGHTDWNKHDELGRFISKPVKKKKEQLVLDDYASGYNLRIIKVECLPYKEDVYDMEVETYHNFLANGLVVHNCGEQPLPENGSCNLGSLDISKFLDEDNTINLELLELATRLSIRFLDRVIDVNSFPTKDIDDMAKKCRQIGLGIMGLADYYLQRGIAYGSEKALEELSFILSFIKSIAEDESIELGEKFGVPEYCKNLPVPRRNITLLSIAPTGTISLLANCNSGIEPFFSEITIRNDKTGSYELGSTEDLPDYFRCAVSANGAKEVTWEEHVETQATSQKFIDSGVSKTINFPNHTHRETIAKAFMKAWKDGCKGITVYRNGSREVEVLSPKNVKKDLCPVCSSELIHESGCSKCSNPDCGFSVCSVG